MKVKYEDLEELRRDVVCLIGEGRYKILWEHIKRFHPGITEKDILLTLCYGYYKEDAEHEKRYLSWSKLTYARKLVRVSFEIHQINGKVVLVITAFEEL
jgi:hypothetical protein